MALQLEQRIARWRHRPVFWAVLLSALVFNAVAFTLVCSHQMRKAESRQSSVQVEQIAFDDCLQYVVGSTIGSCTARLGRQ